MKRIFSFALLILPCLLFAQKNIGINTTNPEAHLHIYDVDKSTLWMSVPAYWDTTEFALRNGTLAGAHTYFTWKNYSDRLRLISNSDLVSPQDSTIMTVSPGGFFGFGNDAPAYTVDVNGSLRVSNLAGTGDRNVIVGAGGEFKIGGISGADTDWIETASAVYNSSKNIGIGTSVPAQKLHMNGATSYFRISNSSGTPPFNFSNTMDVTGQSINVTGSGLSTGDMRLQNTSASSIAMVEGGGNVGIGIAAPTLAKVNIKGPEMTGTNLTTTPATLSILNDNGSIQQMLLDGNEINTVDGLFQINNRSTHDVEIAAGGGDVSIGTATMATGYKLSVAGKIIAEEVRVQLEAAWPDYVFEEDYSLMPLPEVEHHIKTWKHLPGIPSATEITANGLHLGFMQVRMMEKIEELTLYVIEQQKQIEELKNSLKNCASK